MSDTSQKATAKSDGTTESFTVRAYGAASATAPLAPISIRRRILFKPRRLAGTAIGGIRETQEMLDFCAEHGITADIETIRIQQVNQAYERLSRSDVKYRFVIDVASLD